MGAETLHWLISLIFDFKLLYNISNIALSFMFAKISYIWTVIYLIKLTRSLKFLILGTCELGEILTRLYPFWTYEHTNIRNNSDLLYMVYSQLKFENMYRYYGYYLHLGERIIWNLKLYYMYFRTAT